MAVDLLGRRVLEQDRSLLLEDLQLRGYLAAFVGLRHELGPADVVVATEDVVLFYSAILTQEFNV